MMNYEMFKEVVAEQIVNYMPDGFESCKAEIRPALKINQMLDELELTVPMKESTHAKHAKPQIYVNHIYEEYKKSGNLKEALEMAALELVDAYRKRLEGRENNFLQNVKDKLIMQLVNTEQNKELLRTIPHRQFQDLSIVYRVVAEIAPNGVHSALVDKSLSDWIGMKESELYEAAMINTKRLFPPVIKTMDEVLRDMFAESGMPLEIVGMEMGDISPEQAMYVISNTRQVNGAVSILYEEELHTLAEKLGTDLYIMPSSIHEAIAVSVDMGDPNEMAQMVTDINMSQVSLDERLSNQVYHYDKELRKISLATDTPNKRLDRIVAEPSIPYETKQSR